MVNQEGVEVKIKFVLGEFVFLKTDPEQNERQVTRIQIGMDSDVMYCLSFGTDNSWHYATEIDLSPNVLKVLGLNESE